MYRVHLAKGVRRGHGTLYIVHVQGKGGYPLRLKAGVEVRCGTR